MEMLVFVLFLASAICATVATVITPGAGKLFPAALALLAAGLAVLNLP